MIKKGIQPRFHGPLRAPGPVVTTLVIPLYMTVIIMTITANQSASITYVCTFSYSCTSE